LRCAVAVRSGLAVGVFVALLTAALPVRAASPLAAALAGALPSLVLVEGDERTTGFVVAEDAQYAYVVTAAHVLDPGRYLDNEHVPATIDGVANFKLTPAEFISVRVPSTGAVVTAEIVGAPNFEDDLLVARIPATAGTFRPMCLANALMPNSQIGVATFSLTFLNGPIAPNVPFAMYRMGRSGDAGTVAYHSENEFEFQIPTERGFSGAPVFHLEDGLVIGTVRRSAAALVNATTPTMLAVTPNPLRAMVERATGDDNFPVLGEPVGAQSDWPRVPDLSLAGRLRLIRFDDPSTGDGTVPFVYTGQEGRLLSGLRSAFGKGGFPVDLVEDTVRSVPVTTKLSPRFESKICKVRGTSDAAAGAIAIRRTMRREQDRSMTVFERVMLLDCQGNVIDAADLVPTQMGGDGKFTPGQAPAFARALNDALASLAGPGVNRLGNFALDGMPFGNGEYRGFYTVRSDGTRAWIRAGWSSGAGYDRSKLYKEIEVTSVDGHPDPIGTLTAAELERLIAAAGPAGVAIVSPDAAAPSRLRAADRCFTLWRRQQMMNAGVFNFDKRDGVNVL
jgi:Trypsin-like peptidase domain